MRSIPLARSTDNRRLSQLLVHARFEVLPTPGILDRVLEHLPRDLTVTVTSSPRKGLEATVELAESLAGSGYHAVPHLAARLLADAGHVREVSGRLKEAGIDEVFVPAGDADPPAGEFDGALPVLLTLSQLEEPFARVGITGYPESHPQISDDVTIQSMWDKRHYADYIVSNVCFDPAVLRNWVRRVRARGVTLPLYLGVVGPSDPAKLVDVARRIGVSESARFAGKHLRWLARLSASPGGYHPDRLLQRVGPVITDEAMNVAGVHVFTFNQVADAEAWRRRFIERYEPEAAGQSG